MIYLFLIGKDLCSFRAGGVPDDEKTDMLSRSVPGRIKHGGNGEMSF